MDKLDIAIRALEKISSNHNNTDLVSDTAYDALSAIANFDNPWITNIKHNPPPNKKLVQLLCDDYIGEHLTIAMRQDYKKPVKGQCKKGFRKGWRWIGPDGQTLTRKEAPTAWRYL